MCWIWELLKIEGIGQIDFSADRLLLKRSENMRRKYGPPPLHLAFLLQLIVSEGGVLIGRLTFLPVERIEAAVA